MWKLSIEDDQGHKTVVSLVRDDYSVGRAQDNTIRLTERNISRHHAIVRRGEAGWELEDRASYNGCYVNGTRVADPRPLEHGDLIQLGDYRLEVIDEAAAQVELLGSHANTVPQLVQPTSAGQTDRLVMLVGPSPGSEFLIVGKNLLIGRGEECDLAINHGSVSRVHAELVELGEGRYELIDRESANGIRINGVEMKRALLDARDTIELGDIVLKFIPAGMFYRPGADESQRILGFDAGAAAAGTPGGLSDEAPHHPLLSPGRLAVIGGLLVFSILLAVVVMATNARRAPVRATVATDSAVSVLNEATALLARGEVEAAHAHVTNEIPETSNARESEQFVAIEAAWADALFARAQNEPDRDRRRALLQRIKDTETVDSMRRKRALAELDQLDSGGVDVSELPRATQVAASTPEVQSADDEPPSPRTAAVAAASPRPTVARPTTATTAAAATPKTTTSPQGKVNALAGDRATQLQTISTLKAKKTAGTASAKDLRILRALCRQHGDPSCS